MEQGTEISLSTAQKLKKAKYLIQWRKDNPELVREQRQRNEKNRDKEKRSKSSRNSKEKRKELTIRWRKKIHDWINEYKLSNGCCVCGYNKYAEVLDFHHNSEKEFDIGRCRKLERTKKEVEKCIVLCSNCHKELHLKERSIINE